MSRREATTRKLRDERVRRALSGAYVRCVNGVFDGHQLDTDEWITDGTQSSNTVTVQVVHSAGNRSELSSVTLENQTC